MPNDSRKPLPTAAVWYDDVAIHSAMHFMENRDEHRRNILQEIFRLGALEKRGVLAQLIRHLIDDEIAALRERFIRFRRSARFFLISRMLNGIPERM